MVRYQSLEARRLLSSTSVTLNLRGSTLFITGTSESDQVVITTPSHRTLRVETGDEVTDFSTSNVRRIVARLGLGDDTFSARSIRVAMDLDGQAGNDTLLSGDSSDTLWGGGGDDSLRAGNGRDIVYAGDGNDTVFGEAGSDTLFGDAGNDRLVGGADYDVIRGLLGRDRFDPAERYSTEVFDFSPRLDVPV
jgi:Ca2+-binding RTX toxin-like protein